MALHKLGVPLTLNPISFEEIRPDLGVTGEIISELAHRKIDYNVNIIHTTPEFWAKHREEGKINIGYTIWETTRLHPKWKDYINHNVDAVMVGCEWNVEVFKDSGVEVPIFVVPHGIDVSAFNGIEPYRVGGVKDDTFMFYSIFQWTERKHPLALIKAYWHAFQNREDVALVLKTYRSDYSDPEKDAIRTTIKRLKHVTPMDNYPPIYLIPNMLTDDEILGLHARGDCYVSLDRGEGFGLSPFTAGACGNPIVVTNFGGSTEYAKEHNSFLVNYVLTPVFGMPWSPWYRGDQLWAEPDVKHGADIMKYIYENQDKAKLNGQVLKEDIRKNFAWEVIGQKIIDGVRNM
jgi:glycosyltransferase involved in cell wall biosynthesis